MTPLDENRRDELRRRDEEAGRPPAVERNRRPRADELPCGNCGEAPPGAGLRRHVPHRGRTLPVCPDCAKRLDDQLVLEARGIAQVDRAVNHYERLTGTRDGGGAGDVLALMRELRAA